MTIDSAIILSDTPVHGEDSYTEWFPNLLDEVFILPANARIVEIGPGENFSFLVAARELRPDVIIEMVDPSLSIQPDEVANGSRLMEFSPKPNLRDIELDRYPRSVRTWLHYKGENGERSVAPKPIPINPKIAAEIQAGRIQKATRLGRIIPTYVPPFPNDLIGSVDLLVDLYAGYHAILYNGNRRIEYISAICDVLKPGGIAHLAPIDQRNVRRLMEHGDILYPDIQNLENACSLRGVRLTRTYSNIVFPTVSDIITLEKYK